MVSFALDWARSIAAGVGVALSAKMSVLSEMPETGTLLLDAGS